MATVLYFFKGSGSGEFGIQRTVVPCKIEPKRLSLVDGQDASTPEFDAEARPGDTDLGGGVRRVGQDASVGECQGIGDSLSIQIQCACPA